MIEFDHLRMQLKQFDMQQKIMQFVTKTIGSCTNFERLKTDVWVAWFDTSYKYYQLERRFRNELEDIEIEINNTSSRFRELIELKCLERENGLISVTVYFL